MHFNKVLIALQALLLIFITFCLEPALTVSSRHQKGRSALLRIFPKHQRQIEGQGRSALDFGFGIDKQPILEDNAEEEGRGLMKKFLLFKSLFTQQKSEPSSNVIIITQPAADGGTQTPPTTTMPTTSGTTTTMASNADTPTVNGNTGRGTQAQNDPDDGDVFGVLEESKPEVNVQQLIKQMKPNKMRLKKLNGQLRKTQKQQQHRQQQRQQHLQHNKRKRLANRVPQTKPQRNRQQENQLLLLNKINLSQQPNQKSSNNNNSNNNNYNKHNGGSNNNNNNHYNNMASGILNLNTNMRLQNIMNAFRKQTPIVYNY